MSHLNFHSLYIYVYIYIINKYIYIYIYMYIYMVLRLMETNYLNFIAIQLTDWLPHDVISVSGNSQNRLLSVLYPFFFCYFSFIFIQLLRGYFSGASYHYIYSWVVKNFNQFFRCHCVPCRKSNRN